MSSIPQNSDVVITDLLQAGFGLCRVPFGQKNPPDLEWQLNPIRSLDGLHGGAQVGLVCGPLSNNVVCVDLDGIDIEVIDQYLPFTAMEEGRPGRLRSHRWYQITDTSFADDVLPGKDSATRRAMDSGRIPRFPGSRNLRSATDRTVGVELKSAGQQAIVPPSMTKTGPREWTGGRRGDPLPIGFRELTEAVERLATAVGWRGSRKSVTATNTHRHAALGMRDWEIIARAQGAKNGSRFNELWNQVDAKSEGDAALVAMLGFWSTDPAQVERLWLSAPSANRNKTQERADYRSRTIAFALGANHARN